VPSLHIRHLITMKLMGLFRILCCRIMPKAMQIGARILKKWAFECSGLAWFCRWKTELLNMSLSGATYFINSLRMTQCLSVPKKSHKLVQAFRWCVLTHPVNLWLERLQIRLPTVVLPPGQASHYFERKNPGVFQSNFIIFQVLLVVVCSWNI